MTLASPRPCREKKMANPAAYPKEEPRVSHRRTGRRPVGQNYQVFYLEYQIYGGSLTYTESVGKVQAENNEWGDFDN